MMTGGALARGGVRHGPSLLRRGDGAGIVSVALRQVGHPRLSGVRLAIAAASFVTLRAVSAWLAALFPAALSADLACPGRAFACFAFVAACAVLGDRLAGLRRRRGAWRTRRPTWPLAMAGAGRIVGGAGWFPLASWPRGE